MTMASRMIEFSLVLRRVFVEGIRLLDHNYYGLRWLYTVMGILSGMIIAWAVGTRVISRSMFRSSLSKLGWYYHSMYVSPFSFAVVMTDVVACAYSCPILRSILLSVLPSINVKTASSSNIKVRQIIFRPSVTLVWRRVPWSELKEEEEVRSVSPTSTPTTPPDAASRVRTFPIPAPRIIIELRDVCIEMEKLYVAPMFHMEVATKTQQFPSALLATQSLVKQPGKQQPPTFFEEDIALLESQRADAVTYLLEQWLQQQSTKKDATSLTTQRLIQTTLRLLLSTFSLHIRNFSCRVYGPGVETVRSARKNEKKPSDALIALSNVSKKLCAATEFGFQAMEFSFHGYNYELLITTNQFYVQVGVPKSPSTQQPTHRTSRARRRNDAKTTTYDSSESQGRIWSYIIPPNDGLVNLSGILDWLIGDTWETKLFSMTCSFLEPCVILDPEPLHTFFLHFDDYLDSASPFNEWRQWYTDQIKNKSSSQDLLALFQDYRSCYYEQQSLQNRKIAKPEEAATLDHSNTASGIDGDGASRKKQRLKLKSLEMHMTFEQIMEQRLQVMGNLWDVSGKDVELKAFAALNRHNYPPPTILDSSKKLSKSDSQMKKYWFDVLLHLIEQKASFTAVFVTISVVLPSYRVVIVNTTDELRPHTVTDLLFVDLYSKLQCRSPTLPYKQRSDFLCGQKPNCYMKLDGSIQQILWIAEEEGTFSSPLHVEKPYAKLPLGLVFKVCVCAF